MMPGCLSSSRSRFGPDLGLMRLLVSLFPDFAPREFSNPWNLSNANCVPGRSHTAAREPRPPWRTPESPTLENHDPKFW